MKTLDHTPAALLQQTRAAYIWTRLFNIPFWSILSMLTLILYKEMQINSLQIAIFIAIKPLSALFAPYWSASLPNNQHRLRANLILANILRYVPFLLFPWINSPWLMIFAFGIYMMMNRAVMPAWMEIFNRNIKGEARERVFFYGSTLDYLGPALLPLLIGYLLDDYHREWRWLFFISACIGLLSTLFLLWLPKPMLALPQEPFSSNWHLQKSTSHASLKNRSFFQKIIRPWRQSWELIKENKDFKKYQIGFMLGGTGLILVQTIIPIFFIDLLQLTYMEMGIAIALCKGIGFAMTSPLWIKLFRQVHIYYFSACVTLIFGGSFLFLVSSQYHLFFVYVAYLTYGIAQAGSELSWHLSGPIFSHDKDSFIFSQTNVLTVGIRGCLVPFIGSLLYSFSNATVVILCGALLCFLATERLLFYSRLESTARAVDSA